jgi:hypothetical protein
LSKGLSGRIIGNDLAFHLGVLRRCVERDFGIWGRGRVIKLGACICDQAVGLGDDREPQKLACRHEVVTSNFFIINIFIIDIMIARPFGSLELFPAAAR